MTTKHPLSLAIAVAGAACMAAIAFGLWVPHADHPFIGARLYDVYARMLIEGRLDLPVRELRFEGHYARDGTGYMYHGLGPLLTRIPFIPFVELPTAWLSALSIWFWAVAGNACFHRAFVLGLDRVEIAAAGGPVRTLLAFAVWFASPGMLLVGNGSVYYEPVAMAYGLNGGFILLIAMISFGKLSLERALPWLAVIAGLMVHARPHLAVGLYVGVCVIAFLVVRRGGRRNWTMAGLAVLLLGLFGGLLLAFNAARFHNATVMHGSFANSDLQYGTVYWGYEKADNERAQAFEQHGRFNAGRILPNLLYYGFAPPLTEATKPAVLLLRNPSKALSPIIGKRRFEEPRAGILFLWPFWMLLMAIGLRQKSLWRMPALAGLIAAFIGSALMLSYVTISLRYHVDLWPAIALPAVFGVGPFAAKAYPDTGGRWSQRGAIMAALLVGVAMTALLTQRSRGLLIDAPGGFTGRWSFEHCLKLTARRGFPLEKGRALCRPAFDGVDR
jgi:hypothetical protein